LIHLKPATHARNTVLPHCSRVQDRQRRSLETRGRKAVPGIPAVSLACGSFAGGLVYCCCAHLSRAGITPEADMKGGRKGSVRVNY